VSVRPAGQRHTDTRALVTGGGQGIGLAIAEALAAEGCRRLTIVGRDRGKLDRAAEGLRATGASVATVAADISIVAECERVIAEAIAAMDGVNVLVNAAATTERGSIENTTEEVFNRIYAINVKGPFFLMQGVVRHALEKGTPASILNILSTSAHGGQPFLTTYSSSKGALAVVTRNVAHAYRRNRIRCNAILPGWTDTPGEDAVQRQWHGATDGWLEKAEANQPMGQLGKPDQIALLAAYVLSPDAGIMTGALIDYDQHILGTAG